MESDENLLTEITKKANPNKNQSEKKADQAKKSLYSNRDKIQRNNKDDKAGKKAIEKHCTYCKMVVNADFYNIHVESHPSKILDWLYLGSYNNALNKQELQNLNIKCILNCAVECKSLFTDQFKYKHVTLADKATEKISVHLDSVLEFMENACANNENLFVHCQMGKSRSVSFIIAYLMKFKQMRLDDAYLYVKKLRRIAFPNIGFMRQLKEFEKHLFSE